jgi:arylsulfatase A-like enzyme
MKMGSLMLLLFLSLQGNAQTAPRKNVILIMVDDLNDWAQPFGGNAQAKTPNLKAFASKAVAFQAASCASPVCNPSRTALLIGRRPFETGIANNTFENGKDNFRQSTVNFVKDAITLPQYFKNNGYETINLGKVFHKPNSDAVSWSSFGPSANPQGCPAGPTRDQITVPNPSGEALQWSEYTGAISNTGDFKNAKFFADYLGQSHSAPFFLACGIYRPHLPFFAPQSFFDKFPLNTIELPAGYRANDLNDVGKNNSNNDLQYANQQGKWKNFIRAYLASVAFADSCIGLLLKSLAQSQYASNTIVVIAGDHGWHLGEKEHIKKATMWERASKTAFMIYDPSRAGSGDCSKAVSLQDIYPTLVDLCALPKPNFTVRGRSLKPLLNDPTGANWKGAALTTLGVTATTYNHSLRSDQYRYIKMSNGDEELYDIVNDKWEFTNLASNGSFSAVLTSHRAALNSMLQNNNEDPFGVAARRQTEESSLVSERVVPAGNDDNTLQIYPSLALPNSQISIQYKHVGEDGELANIFITNTTNGNIVWQKQVVLNNGLNNYKLPANTVNKGMYAFSVTALQTNNTISKKLLIQE